MWDRAAKTLRCDFPTCERMVSLYRTLTPQTAVVARQAGEEAKPIASPASVL